MSDPERTPDSSAADGPAQGNDDEPGNVVPLRPEYGRRRRRAGGTQGYVETGSDGADATVPDFAWAHLPGNGKTGGGNGGDEPPRPRVRIKKLRVFALIAGLGLLAAISTLFGMLMALASDLPALEEPASTNSVVLDRDNREIGLLTGNQRRIYLNSWDIAPVMKHAIVAIEDKRFFTNDGVDLRGTARALWQDIASRQVVQGGSTITQQFVKTSLAAQDERTLLNKIREAALAYHVTRKWDKQRILRNYLNTIYFGNGAYGIESAARVYFGKQHSGCGERGADHCASLLEPHEAALLAGMVQSPSAYDPTQHPQAAKHRRDIVLDRMLQQGYISRVQHDQSVAEPVPTRTELELPREETAHPYFTSWVKQQVVDKLGGGQVGARLAFEGGLRVRTTIDGKLQQTANNAITQWLGTPNGGPRASLVAIDNKTGEVRAMVGGDDYASHPFNLATQGQRQPGSAFKPFVLAEALKAGITPGTTWESKKKVFKVPGSSEKFTVNNYENAYHGITTLGKATYASDNAVYAQVGIKVGTKRIARLARRMGIRSPVSDNWAMTLGGLKQGVTPLDMAHAYETFATGGKFVYGTLSPGEMRKGSIRRPGPVGITAIGRGNGDDFHPIELPSGERARNRTRRMQVLDPAVAGQVTSLLKGVVKYGTGTRAQLSEVEAAGKTGTTENYGDAWFVGYTRDYTVAVWVGYPDHFKPMKTEFQGEPVAGGTYPAGIWRTFMEGLLKLDPPKESQDDAPAPPEPSAPTDPAPGVPPGETAPAPQEPAPQSGMAPAPAPEQPVPEQPAPEQAVPEQPAPAEPAPDQAAPQGGAAPAQP
jgi:penicillin-binding protein 1A